MKIGVLSDTHGYLDPAIEKYLEPCDQIVHAGDIGSIQVLTQLQQWKPTLAVWGNIDAKDIQLSTEEFIRTTWDGLRVLIIHIAGKSPRYTPQVQRILKSAPTDLLICGHSHLLKVAQDTTNQLLYMNPGACGHHGFHQMRTLLRFDVVQSKPANLEVVELGKRGRARS